jgi:hypothetical protein
VREPRSSCRRWPPTSARTATARACRSGSASLQEDEPCAGYDALSAGEVIERLREADEDTRAHARDYEGRHRQRDEVLSATQPKIGKQ